MDRERQGERSHQMQQKERGKERASPPGSPAPPLQLPAVPPLLSACDSTRHTRAHARTRTHARQMPASLLPVTVAVRAQDELGEADETVATRMCGKESAGRLPARLHSSALGELSPLTIRKPSKLKPPSLRCPQCQSGATTSAAPAGSAAHQ